MQDVTNFVKISFTFSGLPTTSQPIKMNQNSNSLHLALKEPSIEKKKNNVKQLIADGADLNERNEHCETPLHVAISQGLEDVAAELITRMSVKMLNTLDGFGLTFLHLINFLVA